ncbi:hypothetical protein MRB53_040238 [Persea americana]|nr:hypothetical protein MRB53_040238 [Persea americana]
MRTRRSMNETRSKTACQRHNRHTDHVLDLARIIQLECRFTSCKASSTSKTSMRSVVSLMLRQMIIDYSTGHQDEQSAQQ